MALCIHRDKESRMGMRLASEEWSFIGGRRRLGSP